MKSLQQKEKIILINQSNKSKYVKGLQNKNRYNS